MCTQHIVLTVILHAMVYILVKKSMGGLQHAIAVYMGTYIRRTGISLMEVVACMFPLLGAWALTRK